MRIVIVEDELKIRTGMAKLICAHTAHQVVGEAQDGRDGLEMILRTRPELVISDIRMPNMDGLEMLEELNRLQIKCRFVILSGYSEFEYAQKALRYGADDYLLKPLAPEDVIGMLEKIQKQIDEEEQRQAETVEGLLRSLLIGACSDKDKAVSVLRTAGGFSKERSYILLAGYLGDTDVRYINHLTDVLEQMKEKYTLYNMRYVMVDNIRQMFCIFQNEGAKEELRARLQRRLYMNLKKEDMPVWAMREMDRLEDLPEAGKRLREMQMYALRLGYRTVLTQQETETVKMKEYEYPKQAESVLRNSICSGTAEQIQQAAELFKQEVRRFECEPRCFGQAYEKVLNRMGGVFQDMDSVSYREIQNMNTARILADAVTIGEMERCFDRVMKIIADSRNTKEDIRNYAILRAINFIKDHYRENISLEQLANYLDMTPEYLSTLFNKEVGINFSSFLKQFRISHAKRLLKGSGMKIYEIAQAVGYNDPKYFNRVFKEETGISPGDYRQQ